MPQVNVTKFRPGDRVRATRDISVMVESADYALPAGTRATVIENGGGVLTVSTDADPHPLQAEWNRRENLPHHTINLEFIPAEWSQQ